MKSGHSEPATNNVNQIKAAVISTVLANKTLAALETIMLLQAELLAHLQNAPKEQVADRCRQLYAQQQIKNALNIDLLASDASSLEKDAAADNTFSDIDAQLNKNPVDRTNTILFAESHTLIVKTQ